MVKYKAVVHEKPYGGHYGVGDTPKQAMENLLAVMKSDGSRWGMVIAFVLAEYETDHARNTGDRVVLGFGKTLRCNPEKLIRRMSAKRLMKEVTVMGHE